MLACLSEMIYSSGSLTIIDCSFSKNKIHELSHSLSTMQKQLEKYSFLYPDQQYSTRNFIFTIQICVINGNYSLRLLISLNVRYISNKAVHQPANFGIIPNGIYCTKIYFLYYVGKFWRSSIFVLQNTPRHVIGQYTCTPTLIITSFTLELSKDGPLYLLWS